jgi:hypothetical protein
MDENKGMRGIYVKKHVALLASTLCTTFLLFGCNEKNTTTAETEASEIAKLEKTIAELQREIASSKDWAKFSGDIHDMYAASIKQVISKLNHEELVALSKHMWKYDIQVDGQSIPKDGTIQIHSSLFDLSFVRHQLADILPLDIHNKGAISGNYTEHITKMEPKPSVSYTEDGVSLANAHHRFTDIKEGNTVSITITEELKQRLGLDTTTITIQRTNNNIPKENEPIKNGTK